jgi:hypothetical protein
MMQQFFPLQVVRRLPEADGMVFQRIPFHKQDVFVLLFDAFVQRMFYIAVAGADVLPRRLEVPFKFVFLSAYHI